MGLWQYLPAVVWCLFVLITGLMIGSFLNVLIARLPREKSIIWPSSRCFACFKPVNFTDNIPIIGYLRLRGRCRYCGVQFSSRYLWVEIGTGLATLALFVLEVLMNWQNIKPLDFKLLAANVAIPPPPALAMFFYHAILLWALIAAAVIDAEHREIPALIPFVGLFVGVVGGALMPWPWPNPDGAGYLTAAGLPPEAPWSLVEFWGKVPTGVQPWPFYGPTFGFAPPGSFTLGLLNGLIGALAGSLIVRLIKGLFELGFGHDAMGMGDADLLMMAGAFLGWQIAVLSLFTGALAALFLKVLQWILVSAEEPKEGMPEANSDPLYAHELPFGPGLALGVIGTWFAWPFIGAKMQYVFFDWVSICLCLFVLSIGVLAAGLLLRRPAETSAPPSKV